MHEDAPRSASDVVRAYELRRDRFRVARDGTVRRSSLLAHARLLTFLGTAVSAWVAASASPDDRGLLSWIAAVLVVAFAVLARAHSLAKRRGWHYEQMLAVTEEGLARVARRWQALSSGVPHRDQGHPYAGDLGLLGHASLWQLLGGVSEAPGAPVLRRWLLGPAAAPAIARDRQAGVAELAARIDLRDQLAVHARASGVRSADLERFLGWAEDEPVLAGRRGVVWTARLLTLATLALGVWWLRDLSSKPLWLAPVLANVVVLVRHGRRARDAFDRGAGPAEALGNYASSFSLLEEASFSASILARLRAELDASGVRAAHQVGRLERLLAFAALRHTAMMHVPVNLITLYDVHLLAALDRWKLGARPYIRRWFGALGEIEALAALGALAHDNPDWAFPTLADDGSPHLEATALGHPLLPPTTCVANDVTVGPPGTFQLVTGSNMSGKSTLLRAIGVNVVLAQAGGPVCATAMRLSPVDLRTAMHVQDSLEQGVSLFMAELLRLRDVVDAARESRSGERRTVLYLLDEILYGTNTAERQIAARRILGHLIGHGAIGAVSTHDLSLADAPPIASAARAVHFTECLRTHGEGPPMWFDYRLRPGLATSVNALKLLDLVGLSSAP